MSGAFDVWPQADLEAVLTWMEDNPGCLMGPSETRAFLARQREDERQRDKAFAIERQATKLRMSEADERQRQMDERSMRNGKRAIVAALAFVGAMVLALALVS